MSLIYHYTSLPALQSIIQNRSVWCSDLRYLNDYQEVRIGQETIRNFADLVFSHFGKSEATKLLQEKLYEISEDSITAFSTCFSKNSDQLSQWRGYGIDGKGVAIGFDRSEFEAATDLNVRDVIYGSSSLVKEIEPRVKLYVGELEEHHRKNDDPHDLLYKMKGELLQVIFSTKGDAFAEEEESRLIILLSEAQKRTIRYRSNDIFLIPYVNLEVGEKMKACIKEIVVGPSSHQQEIARSINEFMRFSGYVDVEINTSSASYRV